MGFQIIRFETTPNPNAIKCWVDRPISAVPRSFLNSEMAESDPIACRMFAEAPVTTLLFNGDWLTVNKEPNASWPKVKAIVKSILESCE